MKTWFKILMLLLISEITNAQQHLPNSTIQAFQYASNDSLRYIANRKAYDYFEERNRDSALYYAEQSLLLAQRNNKKLPEASAFDRKGYQLMSMGRYAEALPCLQKAFNITESPKNESKSWLTTQLTAQKNRLLLLSFTHHMFAILMAYTQNNEQCIFHNKEAKKIAEGIEGNLGKQRVLLADMNLGAAYADMNKNDSALIFTKEARDVALQTGEKKYLAFILKDFGDILLKKSDTAKAKQYYYEAIQSAKEQNNLSGLNWLYTRVTKFYLDENEKDSSLVYAKKMLETLKVLGPVSSEARNIGIAYENLYYSYKLRNQFDSAFKYAALALVAKDSINKKRIASLAEFQNLTFGEQLRLQQLEKEKELYQSNIKTYTLLGGIFIFVVIAFLLYRNNRNSKKANALLQKQKGELQTAFHDLKSTQSQLIQSEKMASLGELTAGIAHEIQNPLNFVNNFSEVNKDMLEELKAERLKPTAERNNTLEDELINDVIDNSEKINHHGKRAGDIVKGMLQHSRVSTGTKEPTNINALADEYLRLSYHGLRAKDKSFNAEIVTNFDNSIGKINIIPQDIGRVLLNLYNNAFYATNERQNTGNEHTSINSAGHSYEPTVSVTTKKSDNHVIITVSDNGNGIPQNIVDKIFQPFFTTKPTGSGTGLGLSLSYDIVKAHGGGIKVESKEVEGSEFIIQLPFV